MYRESLLTIMKDEKELLLLKKFVRIEFGARVFYLPCIPANIYFENNTLSIDMADTEEYVIVDGIRCYYCVTYNRDNDTIGTWLKDYALDGVVFPQQHFFSFSLSDREFPFSQRDLRMVAPKRDYSELASVFLDEHKDLDERIVKFLEMHPEYFEQISIKEWLLLNDQVAQCDIDPDLLPESISDLFQDFIKKWGDS